MISLCHKILKLFNCFQGQLTSNYVYYMRKCLTLNKGDCNGEMATKWGDHKPMVLWTRLHFLDGKALSSFIHGKQKESRCMKFMFFSKDGVYWGVYCLQYDIVHLFADSCSSASVCDQLCVDLPERSGHTCACKPGYHLHTDGFSCVGEWHLCSGSQLPSFCFAG